MARRGYIDKQNGDEGGSRPHKKSDNAGRGVKRNIVKKPRVNVARAGVNIARKNVVRGDARLKILAKTRSKVVDARDRLASIAQRTDARDKLEKMRKGKVTRPLQWGSDVFF